MFHKQNFQKKQTRKILARPDSIHQIALKNTKTDNNVANLR